MVKSTASRAPVLRAHKKMPERQDKVGSPSRALAVIGGRWTLALLGLCFGGVTRFEDFRARTGMSRTIVAARLKMLTHEGVLSRTAYQDRPARYDYRLTEKGLGLRPLFQALNGWADAHYAEPVAPSVTGRRPRLRLNTRSR